MITQRTKHAELAVRLLATIYGDEKLIKLTEKQALDLLIWIKEVEKYLEGTK